MKYYFGQGALRDADTAYQQVLIRHPTSGCESIVVDFSILLSPTYQVPVLWFTIHEVPLHGPSGLDAVYQYLVPDLQKSGIRQVGILGGISMAVWPPSILGGHAPLLISKQNHPV